MRVRLVISHGYIRICCMIPSTWHPGKGKTMETVKKISGCQGCGRGRDEQTEHRGLVSQ